MGDQAHCYGFLTMAEVEVSDVGTTGILLVFDRMLFIFLILDPFSHMYLLLLLMDLICILTYLIGIFVFLLLLVSL